MYKICFFVPEDYLEQTKTAVFAAGGGTMGNYDSCCWQTRGQGQFRPADGSQPFIGQQGKLETVPEFRVELVCEDDLIRAVIRALKAGHPYEEPAYEVYRMENI